MKRFSIYTLILIITILVSCKREDFLDRIPPTSITEEAFFKTENDLKLYANRFYDNLPPQGIYNDGNSDNNVPRNKDTFLAGQYIVPNTDGNWDFSTERALNYFLVRYTKVPVSADIQNKYAAEIKFFRAYTYWRKVVRYGNVPWLNKDLTEQSPELYAPRDPHKVVMDSVLKDLNFAVSNLPEKINADKDRLNKDVALALKARICLWEGTFRKYQSLGDETPFLREAVNAAEALMTKGYSLYTTGNPNSDYLNLFTQEELRNNTECILARRYLKDVTMHNLTRIMNDNWPSFSKNFVRSFLCKDGLPTALSPLYKGDDTPDDEATNRDPRYPQIVVTRGYVVANRTDGSKDVVTLPRIPSTSTGYAYAKWHSPDPAQSNANQSTLDLFLFRYAETLLIEAEAKAELGEINQGVIDNTINKLRDRVGMARMNMASLVKDPNSDFPAISVVLDEVRRERRIELAGDNFRFDDLLRWKAGKLIENPETILGMKLTPALIAQYPASQVSGIQVNSNNYIRVYTDITSRVWNDKMYLYPLPLDQLNLNPKLLPQNFGW